MMGAVILAGGASFAGTESSATFKAGRFIIPTLEQFDNNARKKYPTLKIEKQNIENIEYKGQSYEAMAYQVDGVRSGTKHVQTTSYIHLLPGLWKLLYVESKTCNFFAKGKTVSPPPSQETNKRSGSGSLLSHVRFKTQ